MRARKSTADIVEAVRQGYSFAGPTLELGALVVDGAAVRDVPVRVPLSMVNRHGLVSGATGTGKTKTLQMIAEQLSTLGVPVFLADIKGDLSGLASPGQASEEIIARAREVGQDWQPVSCPVEFYALGGAGAGIPVRATIKSFGPTLLAKVLGLGEVQESSLGLVFHFADKKSLPLFDLNDLRAVIRYLTSDEGAGELKALGGLSAATAGVILRQLITLEDMGADQFFGEPGFDTADLLRTTEDGRGVISCLELAEVQDQPKLFSTFLMWLLADLFHRLPEVGDTDRPRLVFFLDEAHLLFQDASRAFLGTIEHTVRLIRSKGVGVFFLTQTPQDVPGRVLAQLGNRVQHALRVFTPEDARTLKATVSTFPHSSYDLETVLTGLPIGEAAVTVLSEHGAPTPVAWTRLRVPRSRMAPTEATAIEEAAKRSPLAAKYAEKAAFDSASTLLAKSGEASDLVRGPAGRAVPKPTASRPWAGNLPADFTSFVGRRHEVAEARRLLGESRLVTLTGFGGVGKTRLALRVARELERSFRDGVWLVDLAPLRDPGLVAQSVAAAVGMRDESSRWALTVLAEYLAGRQLVLLLDNCEHLLDPCAVLAETVLRRAPELRILATSRQPLGVAGERTLVVPPLPVPDVDRPTPSAGALAQYDAVALFIDRAKAVMPDFAVTEDNVEAVTRLTQRLDGIPLALELAAARTRVLSPGQIVNRLHDRYRLLSSGPRTARPQQQSLQALIDWSFDLCSAEERTLWARLTVFPRDFDVEAAEEICPGEGLAREEVLDALAGLVDKSVLVVDATGSQVRYRLPETLREYGLSRLAEQGQEIELRRRHRDHYRRLCGRAAADWFGPRQVEWTKWAQVEYVNLRAALEFCLAEPGEAGRGLAMFPGLATYWVVTGSLGEGQRFLERALAAETAPSLGRARALWIVAGNAVHQGDLAAAEAAGEESRRLAQQYGDAWTFGYACVYLGMARMLAGDLDSADALFREALEAAADTAPVAALALVRLAETAVRRGDVATAAARCGECVAICEAHGDSWVRAEALWTWAALSWEQGDTGQATALARESLRLRAAFHDQVGIAQCLEVLAWIASERAPDRAARLLGAADAVWRAVGGSLFPHFADHHHRCTTEIKRRLGNRGYDQAFRRGGRRALTDTVADALGEKPEPATAATGEKPALTRREREIADLVAQGLRNREIAAKLVISQRTADSHVEHILTKLGFRTRAQIAAWVAEHRMKSAE